jgi:DNA-binding HxlR family transcriptional regulator
VLGGRLSGDSSDVRAGAHSLRLATEPVKRKILLGMVNRDLRWTDGQVYTMSPGGREAVFVGGVAERWLEGAPGGSLEIDGDRAQAALTALIKGWSAAIVHELAAAPASLSELDARLDDLPRAVLKDLLARMRAAGLLATPPGAEDDGDAPYAPTDWLRAGLAPLLAAARLELREPVEGAVPPTPFDVEAAFRLALPLLRLPEDASGSCALAVELDPAAAEQPCGLTARVKKGQVVGVEPGLDSKAGARAEGAAVDWLDTVIEPGPKRVRTSGDRLLAGLILVELHGALFGAGSR